MRPAHLFFLAFAVICGCSEPPMRAEIPENANISQFSFFPDAELEREFLNIAKNFRGKVGVAAVEIETGRSAFLNPDEHFAMQSVVKLPISMSILKKVENGDLALDGLIAFNRSDLVPKQMRSPIRDKYPEGGELTLREFIIAAVSESDGTASDVLQRLAGDVDGKGGANGVQKYVDGIGLTGMKITRSHKEFARDWDLQYENWATPTAAVTLLQKLLSGDAVQAQNRDFLLKAMTESNNPDDRLKGMLPKDAIVAHKTGTGGTRNGITSATNDVGIITLPNGRRVAIAVFVGDSSANERERAAVIARIAKSVWDRWTAIPPPPNSNSPIEVNTVDFNLRHSLG